jgi:hypothetical protein
MDVHLIDLNLLEKKNREYESLQQILIHGSSQSKKYERNTIATEKPTYTHMN